MITVSIVSHGHGILINRLIGDLLVYPEIVKIIITKNIPEKIDLPISSKILMVENSLPKGFGSNHNHAFKLSSSNFFCILNPDIEFLENPFGILVKSIVDNDMSIISPVILNKKMEVEDHARKFPTFFNLVKKFLWAYEGRMDSKCIESHHSVDWIAGMFMLFKTEVFKSLGGFDVKYFLYYEDVDICVRAWRKNFAVGVEKSVHAIHDARRTSRRSLPYAYMHLKSLIRYLIIHSYNLPRYK